MRRVINSFNKLGLLIESGLLPAHLVFNVSHSQLIRFHWRLTPYMQFYSDAIGAAYGRRLDRIVVRARIYHDAQPLTRGEPIVVHGRVAINDQVTYSEGEVIYTTAVKHGVAGKGQQLGWLVRRILKWY